MANEKTARYRSDDPYVRTPAAGGPLSNDPLAELARLIGQGDPFSESEREARQGARQEQRYGHVPDLHYGNEPAPYDQSAPYTGESPPPYAREPASQYDEPAPHYRADPAPHYAAEPQSHYAPESAQHYGSNAAPADWHAGAPAPAPAYDPYAQPVHQAPVTRGQHYDVSGYAVPGLASQSHAPRHQDLHGHDHGAHEPYLPEQHLRSPQMQSAPEDYHSGYETPRFAPSPPTTQEPQGFPTTAPPFHRVDGQTPSDDFYDDAPERGRRKGMITVIAVLCLAVMGTAVAFGYRSIFGGSTSAAPPVIRASAEPTKVAPPPTSADSAINKLSYDRFGDRGQNEKVMVREEQPLDPRDIVRSSPPRVVTPGGPNGNSSTAASAATGSANPPSVLTEPKRVRTVLIRPDQADGGPAARTQVAAPPPRQTTLAAATPANTPLDVSPQASAQPVASTRSVAPRPVQQTLPPPSGGNAPLSLAPDAGSTLPAAPVRSAPARTAAVTPPPAPAASAGNGGGYHVQVSSQRSESDAQNAFRSIQSKYSSVLGDRQAVIRRADLGAKGTYYRAMVGPFSSREQAVQLCGSLKAAGGDCVVQSN